MVRWLEANGYNVSYTTGVDSDRSGAEILEHKVFLSVGHDEYWSAGQRAAVEAARAAGVNLAFFSGNEVFWKTRWENSIDGSGTARRTLVCYKETHANAKIDPSPVWTGTWRDPRFSPPADGNRPENALTGTLFIVNGGSPGSNAPLSVPPAQGTLRFWRNTGVAALAGGGTTATLPSGTVGYEWDTDADNGSRPPGIIHLSSSTISTDALMSDYGSTYGPGVATHHMTLTGTAGCWCSRRDRRWASGLDAAQIRSLGPAPHADIKQATVNLLADMGAQRRRSRPVPPRSAPTRRRRPRRSRFQPAANFSALYLRDHRRYATDSGGGVAGVEVSVDGGVTGSRRPSRAWTSLRSPTAPDADHHEPHR